MVSPLFTALCRNAGFSVILCCYCCCCFQGDHHLASCPLDTWEIKLSEPFMTSQRANWGRHKEKMKNISQCCSEFSDWTDTEIWLLCYFHVFQGLGCFCTCCRTWSYCPVTVPAGLHVVEKVKSDGAGRKLFTDKTDVPFCQRPRKIWESFVCCVHLAQLWQANATE